MIVKRKLFTVEHLESFISVCSVENATVINVSNISFSMQFVVADAIFVMKLSQIKINVYVSSITDYS